MERVLAHHTTAYEAEHVRVRLRLYLLVLLSVDIIAYVGDAVTLLFGDADSIPQLALTYQLLRWACTGLMAFGWALARFTTPRYLTLVVLETAVTFALVGVYIMLGIEFLSEVAPNHGPTFSLLGIVMLLSLRAALVPSRTARTFVVGLVAMGAWFAVNGNTLDALDQVVREGLVFMAGAIVLATSVTSRVIYGLRRQVRDAMRLGQYQLTRKLGEGGMGVVYRATHLMLRRPTAVKLLPVDKAGAETVARFEREVVQTSRLEHPNSVTIYDYGRTPDGVFYYAMEYVQGFTLAELIALDGPVVGERAVRILAQAASALAEAHALGLVHRDIKPANIMVCERAGRSDVVKVLDFGLVKAIDDAELDVGLTGADRLIGTPHYMAPEAITEPDDVGPAADIYALGAVGYFLVSGREPFPGRSVVEVCSQHLHVDPEPPSTVGAGQIERRLEALILRCLAKATTDRPADGAALADALDGLGLDGWTDADAARWWRDRRDQSQRPDDPATPTQIAVDIAGR